MATWTAKAGRGIALAALAFGLGACGGGGGGSGAGPGAPNSSEPLALTAANHANAMGLAAASADNALMLAQFTADLHDRAIGAGHPGAATSNCPNGGTMTLDWSDRDADAHVSPGDRLTATLRECAVPLLGSVVDGSVTIDVSSTGPVLRATIDAGAGAGVGLAPIGGAVTGLSVQWRGSLSVERGVEALRTRLMVASTAADDFRLVLSGNGRSVTEATQALVATKLLAYDSARSIVSMDLRYVSDALGGTVHLSSPQPLAAYLNTFPETGRLELRGQGTAVAALVPHVVANSEQFDHLLDADGNGTDDRREPAPWASITSGFLWWDGKRDLGGPVPSYATTAYSSTEFSYAVTVPAVPTIQAPVRAQFSRVAAQVPAGLAFRFEDFGSVSGFDPVRANLPADHRFDGAVLQVWPTAPLRHGRLYNVAASTDGGATWSTFGSAAPLVDGLGNRLTLASPFAMVQTTDTMRAAIDAVATTLSVGASVVLDSSASTSARPITSRRWRQVSGPALTLGSPGGAATTVTLAQAPNPGLESAVVELTITDEAGEAESSRLTLSVLRTEFSGSGLYLRSTPGDPIGQGQSLLVIDPSGNLGGGTNPAFPSYTFTDTTPILNFWTISLASSDGSPLHLGSYESAVRAQFRGSANGLDVSGSGRVCSTLTGRFDVLEIEREPTLGAIIKLAVDFEQHCEGPAAPPLFGSLRINSTVPLRP